MTATSTVRFAGGQGTAGGLLATPRGDGPFPAVLLTTAIAGINDYVGRVAGRLAADGYVCLALDYFVAEGGPPDLSDMPRVLSAVANLPDPRVLDDMEAAVGHLREHPLVNADRVAALGFCLGGTYALLAASRSDDLRCAVSFYGMLHYPELTANKPVSPLDAAKELRRPFLGHFGETDHLVGIEDVRELRERVRGKPAEVYTYPGAGHAFHEDFRPAVYRPVAAATAWQRTLTYLDWYLRQSG